MGFNYVSTESLPTALPNGPVKYKVTAPVSSKHGPCPHQRVRKGHSRPLRGCRKAPPALWKYSFPPLSFFLSQQLSKGTLRLAASRARFKRQRSQTAGGSGAACVNTGSTTSPRSVSVPTAAVSICGYWIRLESPGFLEGIPCAISLGQCRSTHIHAATYIKFLGVTF